MKVSIGHKAHFKIVFAGSFGVGKTTAIQQVSDIPVVNTDVKSSELTEALIAGGKTTTTVGFDYGEIYLDDGKSIALYGLPGQKRFNNVWETLLTENTGVVLWLHGNLQSSLADCKVWLDTLKKHDSTRYLTVVITRVETPATKELMQAYRDLVSQYNPYAPIITGDPRIKSQVMQAILMAIANPTLEM